MANLCLPIGPIYLTDRIRVLRWARPSLASLALGNGLIAFRLFN